MLNANIKTISVVITAALLSGCAGSGGTVAPLAAAPAAPAVPAVPAVPAPGTPVTAQCAANTFCGGDAVTVSVPVAVAGGVPTGVTGAATLLGATTFTATLDPVTKNSTSAAISGAVNTSVPVLAAAASGAGMLFTGTAANGQSAEVTAYANPNALNGWAGVPGTIASPAAGLTYANFGDWQAATTAAGAGTVTSSVWEGGTQFTTAMPVAGTATYTGITRGSSLVTAAGTSTPYGLNGNVALTANFATSAVTGNITGITAVNDNGPLPVAAGAFNNIALAGTITGNAFSGTATAGAAPVGVNPAAIAAGTAGTTSGHFYGPAANEVAGVWSMTAGGVQASGSFGAKQ